MAPRLSARRAAFRGSPLILSNPGLRLGRRFSSSGRAVDQSRQAALSGFLFSANAPQRLSQRRMDETFWRELAAGPRPRGFLGGGRRNAGRGLCAEALPRFALAPGRRLCSSGGRRDEFAGGSVRPHRAGLRPVSVSLSGGPPPWGSARWTGAPRGGPPPRACWPAPPRLLLC